MKYTGQSQPRADATAATTGRTRYGADVRLDREVHMALLRAPLAPGRIRAVDTAAAYDVAGVVAVWTAADTALPPLPIRVMPDETLDPFRQPVLAIETVRHAGEPVAAVFARSAAAAEDAAERVVLDIEETRPAGAADDDAAPAATIRKGWGDLNLAFHNADSIVECHVGLAPGGLLPLEGRSAVADWDPGRETLRLRLAGRALHENREIIAQALALPSAAVEIEAPTLGGSFGARGEIYPEDLLVAEASRRLERPVRYVADPREHLAACARRPGLEARARAAVASDGRLLALDVTFSLDQGAYLRPEGTMVAELAAALIAGPYRFDALRITGEVRLSNLAPAGALRGAGRIEATFVRERLLDAVASAMGCDPVDLRRRNLLGRHVSAEPPLPVLGQPVVRAAPGADDNLLERAMRRFAVEGLRRRAAERRRAGTLTGCGLAMFGDVSGFGRFAHARIEIDRRGGLEVRIVGAEAGEGTPTAIAQIVADIVGIAPERVRVSGGRTAGILASGASMLSSGTAMAGTAAQYAAETLRETIIDAAADLLDMPPERLTIRAGIIRPVDGHITETLALGELAEAMQPGSGFAAPAGCGLVAEGWNAVGALSAATGVAVATVEIDPMTGIVTVPRVFVAFDAGNVINPALVERQIVGGALEGVAGALFEAPREGSGAADFPAGAGRPLAPDLPQVEVLVCEDAPTPLNPLGLKGVGAAGIIGIGTAIASAVDDALASPGFARRLPVSPQQVRAHLRLRARQGEAVEA